MDLKAFDESIRSNNFYCDFRSFTIENFPIIFNNRIYVSIKSNRSISFNFSIILIFLKRLLINRKYNLIILEEFFFFSFPRVNSVQNFLSFFPSAGRKAPFDYRYRVVLDDVTVLHSPLTTFLSFFFPSFLLLLLLFLSGRPDIRHTFSLLSLSLPLIFSVIRRRLFSLFFTPRSQITLLYRPFERSWFGGGEKLPCLAACNGTTLWLQGDREGEGRRVLSAIFLFFVISI